VVRDSRPVYVEREVVYDDRPGYVEYYYSGGRYYYWNEGYGYVVYEGVPASSCHIVIAERLPERHFYRGGYRREVVVERRR
jgi:hypothetical protein